ncbi:LysR family transcriptional regulator [Methylocapsa acidiphila]|uniref:LysR family transcriptional regulator n=1 Tax=Methylocapsa acidiphila TaxID=133552 RepID=UPI000404DC63|nr:LysR family transcriptional regulator [Methylocapsa acidiphila]
MELHQIRHFVAIVETGSFTKGAQRASVSQPAISASIAKLEAELDVNLFDRRRPPVVLTPAGERLLEAGLTILHECNLVKAEIKTLGAPKHLRIGILQSLSSRHVSEMLSSFRSANPQVAIEVTDGVADHLVQCLAEQKLDATFTILEGADARFASRILFKEPYVLAVSEDHRFAQRESVTLAELSDEPFIVRTGRDRFQDASNALVSRGVKIKIVYKTDQIDRALALVASGIGVAFIPARFEMPSVRQVPVLDLEAFRTFGLMWTPEREGESVTKFIEFAASHGWSP